MVEKDYYLTKAAEMRSLASSARDGVVRDHFHKLALEYERLATTEPRPGHHPSRPPLKS